MTKEEFETDLKKSIKILEEITKQKINGYRAPSFSITNKNLWVLDSLKKNEIKYDSSIFPIIHPEYGMPDAKKEPYEIKGVKELPPTTGGGYLRILPYWITKRKIKKLNKKNIPAVIYLHPWEFDPEQPRIKAGFLKRIRHYTNLNKTEKKLRKLLKDFRFAPLKEIVKIE
jgi:polysaccharide deacetylase family protein (PEP-CTERM system associated)